MGVVRRAILHPSSCAKAPGCVPARVTVSVQELEERSWKRGGGRGHKGQAPRGPQAAGLGLCPEGGGNPGERLTQGPACSAWRLRRVIFMSVGKAGRG